MFDSTMRAAICSVFVLLTVGSASVSAQTPPPTCDTTCQNNQVLALANLYHSNGGSTWHRGANEWPTFISSGVFSTMCDVLASSETGQCCSSISDSVCRDAGIVGEGVAILSLPYNNLTGTIPESLITALGPTLLTMPLYGKFELYIYLQPCMRQTMLYDVSQAIS